MSYNVGVQATYNDFLFYVRYSVYIYIHIHTYTLRMVPGPCIRYMYVYVCICGQGIQKGIGIYRKIGGHWIQKRNCIYRKIGGHWIQKRNGIYRKIGGHWIQKRIGINRKKWWTLNPEMKWHLSKKSVDTESRKEIAINRKRLDRESRKELAFIGNAWAGNPDKNRHVIEKRTNLIETIIWHVFKKESQISEN